MVRNTPQVPNPPFPAAPQLRPTYVPTWTTEQLGPLPPIPLAQPVPMPPFPMPPVPVRPFPQALSALMSAPPVTPPVAPPQFFGHPYPPGGWGLMLNYFQAPAQLYPISYPPGLRPSYQQYYVGQHGHIEEDSEMAKLNKFTGWEPSKLCPFLISCIITFNS